MGRATAGQLTRAARYASISVRRTRVLRPSFTLVNRRCESRSSTRCREQRKYSADSRMVRYGEPAAADWSASSRSTTISAARTAIVSTSSGAIEQGSQSYYTGSRGPDTVLPVPAPSEPSVESTETHILLSPWSEAHPTLLSLDWCWCDLSLGPAAPLDLSHPCESSIEEVRLRQIIRQQVHRAAARDGRARRPDVHRERERGRVMAQELLHLHRVPPPPKQDRRRRMPQRVQPRPRHPRRLPRRLHDTEHLRPIQEATIPIREDQRLIPDPRPSTPGAFLATHSDREKPKPAACKPVPARADLNK